MLHGRSRVEVVFCRVLLSPPSGQSPVLSGVSSGSPSPSRSPSRVRGKREKRPSLSTADKRGSRRTKGRRREVVELEQDVLEDDEKFNLKKSENVVEEVEKERTWDSLKKAKSDGAREASRLKGGEGDNEDLFFEEESEESKEENMKKYQPKIWEGEEIAMFSVNQYYTKSAYEKDRLKSESGLHKIMKSTKYNIRNSLGKKGLYRADATLRFNILFPTLRFNLSKASFCHLLNYQRNMKHYGELFICSSFICFCSDFYDKEFIGRMKLVIPYADIIAITKAGITYSEDEEAKHPKIEVLPIEAMLKPCVLQIWMRDKKAHQFCGFGSSFDDVFSSAVDFLSVLN